MKHLSKKFAVSLLAGSVTVSSMNATALAEDTSGVTPSSSPVVSIYVKEVSTDHIITSLRDAEAAIKAGSAAQKKAAQLQQEVEALRSKAARLKFQNVVLEAQQQEQRAEKSSTWQRFKNWVSTLDARDVFSTLASGVVTIVITVLLIVL